MNNMSVCPVYGIIENTLQAKENYEHHGKSYIYE
jgi:hypothetical protein